VCVAVVLSLVHACESFAAPAFGSFSGLRGLGRSTRALSVPMMSSGDSPDVQGNKLLVLGATGFVGSEVARQAVNRGYQVVGISRRGGDSEAAKSELGKKIDWRKGDVSKEGVVEEVLSEGGFAGVVHAVGILLEGDMNKCVFSSPFSPQLSQHPSMHGFHPGETIEACGALGAAQEELNSMSSKRFTHSVAYFAARIGDTLVDDI